MSDQIPSDEGVGPVSPDNREFGLSLGDVRDHPAAQPVAKAVCAASGTGVADVDLVAACLSVEVLSLADAKERGEAENSGTLVAGFEVVEAARNCGRDWILARNAQIPHGTDTRAYILSRALGRHDLSLDQMAVLAALLKATPCTGSAGSSSPPEAEAASAEEGASQTAAVVAMVPARLVTMAQQLLRDAPDLADNVLDGRRPLYLATRAAEQRQEKRDCLSGGPCFMAQLRSLTDLLEECLTPDSVPTADRDKVLAALKALSESVEGRSSAGE